jgi:hypothetical protein
MSIKGDFNEENSVSLISRSIFLFALIQLQILRLESAEIISPEFENIFKEQRFSKASVVDFLSHQYIYGLGYYEPFRITICRNGGASVVSHSLRQYLMNVAYMGDEFSQSKKAATYLYQITRKAYSYLYGIMGSRGVFGENLELTIQGVNKGAMPQLLKLYAKHIQQLQPWWRYLLCF